MTFRNCKLSEAAMKKVILATAAFIALGGVAQASSVNVTFTALTGITGGSPAGTGVFRADLSNLGTIASVTIADGGAGGGAAGQFSGFDLDAIVLSTQLISDASGANGLVRAGTFNFATSLFTGGTQTAPADPALFGTTGGQVDNAVATLNIFDGNSIAGPGAFGFVSLGLNGQLQINLTSAIDAGTQLFLYIGEVGNNGEVAAGTISVSDVQAVPGPVVGAGLPGLIMAFGGLLAWRRKRNGAALAA
jgi:hypothetical protein